MKAYMRQSSNCVFAQELDIIFKETSVTTSVIALVDSTSTKLVSINCIAFSPQIFYLIIEDLYHKQKTLFAKIKEDLTVIEAEKAAIAAQKAIEEAVAARKQNSKIKSRNFSESFKSEKFTISFSSTSTMSDFESIIKSNVVFVANSIFISISESSKLNSLRSILSCSTSTILLINQSNYLFDANQLVVHISYQHIVMTFFFSYEK